MEASGQRMSRTNMRPVAPRIRSRGAWNRNLLKEKVFRCFWCDFNIEVDAVFRGIGVNGRWVQYAYHPNCHDAMELGGERPGYQKRCRNASFLEQVTGSPSFDKETGVKDCQGGSSNNTSQRKLVNGPSDHTRESKMEGPSAEGSGSKITVGLADSDAESD